MPLFRVYIAMSVDGFIADTSGGVDWLNPYFSAEIDFDGFISTIGVTVMGRRTFDQARARGDFKKWRGRTIVMTHRPIDDAPEGIETYSGDVSELAAGLRAELEPEQKDIWLMGGGESIRPFNEAGLVDRWELGVIPILLGGGVPLFAAGGPTGIDLNLTHTRTLANGIVELRYEPRSGSGV